MKKRTLITTITINFLLITINLFSQPCLPEGITFTTQEQIDNFQSNYPGCTEILGDMIIKPPQLGPSYITNLNGLSELTSIGGKFQIFGIPYLTYLEGLEGVTAIGGNLIIFHNPSLTNLDGLGGLTSICGDLHITWNYVLTSLDGLDNIVSSSIENLSINCNSSLSFCALQSICDFLSNPNGVVEIYNNAPGCNSPGEVANACGFPIPCLPYGNYFFHHQSDVDSFQVYYPGCTDLAGNVNIEADDITNLLGLNTVNSIGGGLFIRNNNTLANLEGLEGVTTIGGNFTIHDNDAITSLEGLDDLTFIGGDFWIGGNSFLTSLEELDDLTSIEGYLNIGSNDALTSLTGLDGIDEASIESLYIYNNASLSSCAMQSVCDYLVSPGGTIEIYDNAPGCNSPEEVQEVCDSIQTDVAIFDHGATFTISPNPCSGEVYLRFKLDKAQILSCDLIDISGIRIKELISGFKNSGIYELKIDLRDLKPGVYFCTLKTNEGIQTKKLIKAE